MITLLSSKTTIETYQKAILGGLLNKFLHLSNCSGEKEKIKANLSERMMES